MKNSVMLQLNEGGAVELKVVAENQINTCLIAYWPQNVFFSSHNIFEYNLWSFCALVFRQWVEQSAVRCS